MKKSISLYAFFIIALSIWSNAVFALPTITATTSQGITIKFTATLSEKLLSGYKVKIDYGNGKGLVAMTCSGIICTLSSNVLPAGVSKAAYKIGVYNARAALQGLTTDGTYAITYSAPVINSPTTLATAYTKISYTGAILPDTTVLGSGANDWAFTKDNKTGLVWEVKTDDGGLRDKDWYYSWYKPSGDNNGNAGYIDTTHGEPNCSTKDNCNTDAFTNAVNSKGLCGKNDWRMPTIDELMKLLYCSDGKYNTDGYCTNYKSVSTPTINSTYFPNTLSNEIYWSSSPVGYLSKVAWVVDFFNGFSYGGDKYVNGFVRLVR